MSDLKQIHADNWSRTSEQYAERAHQGPGLMMPLIAHYIQVREFGEGLGSTSNTTFVSIASFSHCLAQAITTNAASPTPSIVDVASGSGEPGISLAKLFPSGKVLITDIAPGMIEQAKKRCAQACIGNTRYIPDVCGCISP